MRDYMHQSLAYTNDNVPRPDSYWCPACRLLVWAQVHPVSCDSCDGEMTNAPESVFAVPAEKELRKLIRTDAGDSYYLVLPDGKKPGLGYTAEAYVETSELISAARRVWKRWAAG